MVNIENNFIGKKIRKTCLCGQIEDMKYIYTCIVYDAKHEKIQYENIYGDDVKTIRKAYFKITLKRENKTWKMIIHGFPIGLIHCIMIYIVMEIN